MTLSQFKEKIEAFPEGTIFKNGLSEPFSWRGSYDEVAFSIVESPMSKLDVLKNIERAYDGTFYGYKGGEYLYRDTTPVNFEKEDYSDYSGGMYCAKMIAKFEDSKVFESQEHRLIHLAFSV